MVDAPHESVSSAATIAELLDAVVWHLRRDGGDRGAEVRQALDRLQAEHDSLLDKLERAEQQRRQHDRVAARVRALCAENDRLEEELTQACALQLAAERRAAQSEEIATHLFSQAQGLERELAETSCAAEVAHLRSGEQAWRERCRQLELLARGAEAGAEVLQMKVDTLQERSSKVTHTDDCGVQTESPAPAPCFNEECIAQEDDMSMLATDSPWLLPVEEARRVQQAARRDVGSSSELWSASDGEESQEGALHLAMLVAPATCQVQRWGSEASTSACPSSRCSCSSATSLHDDADRSRAPGELSPSVALGFLEARQNATLSLEPSPLIGRVRPTRRWSVDLAGASCDSSSPTKMGCRKSCPSVPVARYATSVA